MLWGMFPPKPPLWSFLLDVLSDDKKEESKSNYSSRSSYTYDDDDDYDWEKEGNCEVVYKDNSSGFCKKNRWKSLVFYQNLACV